MKRSVRRLRPTDERSVFSSGDVELDRYFQRYAGQNQFKHYVGVTYVAVDDQRILGFATVSAAQLEIRDLPKSKRNRLPNYPLPVLRLARLATDKRVRGQGVGLLLLKSVFLLAQQMLHTFGCVGVLVDAKPAAVQFYERFGFMKVTTVRGQLGDRPEPLLMFLELGALPKADGEVQADD